MNAVSRRDAIKVIAGGGLATLMGVDAARAEHAAEAPADALGLLYDSTICTGCKACVSACSEANSLPPDTRLSGGLWQMPIDLNSHTKNIIKLWKNPDDPSDFAYFKHQCMHCIEPSCAAACPFHALHKGEHGIVAWDGALCIGCRYCEVACPFDVPRFEWDKFNPQIVKCELCHHRLKVGRTPGCTDACPTGAVIFGKRAELLETAKGRIKRSPGRYHQDRVYGEHDAGGTQVLTLARIPYEKLGLPNIGNESVASYATGVHQVLYRWALLPLLLYALLVAIIRRRWTEHMVEAERIQQETGLPEQL